MARERNVFRAGAPALALLAVLASPAAPGRPPLEAEEERMLAPELDGAEAWVNTPRPLRLADLRGKVVLLDFWTYG